VDDGIPNTFRRAVRNVVVDKCHSANLENTDQEHHQKKANQTELHE
jgi:hypothetical protein